MAAKNNKDTYLALSITLMTIGALFLLQRLGVFTKFGCDWIMAKDNLLLIASVIFLICKHDKSVGIVLLGIWMVLNIGMVISFLGQMSGYLLPAALLLVGLILFFMYKR